MPNDAEKRMLKTFVQNLKKRRGDAGLTQESLAEGAGLSKNAVTLIEGEGRNPRLTTIVGLAKGLGCEPWELLKHYPADTKREENRPGKDRKEPKAGALKGTQHGDQNHEKPSDPSPHPTFSDVKKLMDLFGTVEPDVRATVLSLLEKYAEDAQSLPEVPERST